MGNKIYCMNGCGTAIYFDKRAVSKNGKLIPLEEGKDLNGRHNCPKKPYTPKLDEKK